VPTLLQVLQGPDGLPAALATTSSDGQQQLHGLDAVVFAMGIGAMQGVVRASPVLARRDDFAAISELATTDVLAVRLWLDKRVGGGGARRQCAPPLPARRPAGLPAHAPTIAWNHRLLLCTMTAAVGQSQTFCLCLHR
jgi:hypothetical protein